MSCLSVIIERISKSLDVIAERIGGIAVNISRYGTPMQVISTDACKHLVVSCGIVCDIEDLNLSAIKYVNDTLAEGWVKKDSIDWEQYKIE